MIMSDASSRVGPAPMEGSGAYNRSSRVQAGGLLPAVPLLEQSALRVALAQAPQTIVVADYGAAEGHNSLVPMAVGIGALRQRIGSERAISIVHTDLPGSDLAGLFQTLDSDPDSYLRLGAANFASAVGR